MRIKPVQQFMNSYNGSESFLFRNLLVDIAYDLVSKKKEKKVTIEFRFLLKPRHNNYQINAPILNT